MYKSGTRVINLKFNHSSSLRIVKRLCTLENNGTRSILFTNPIERNGKNCKSQFFSSIFNINKPPPKGPSGVKTNFKFHSETESIMNEQINAEFKAFYYYLSMASYFGRVDVSLPGCESFFTQMHHEEHGHALKLMNYIKLRGGSVVLCAIKPPEDGDWKSPLNAFQTALQLEMEVTEKLVAVNSVAEKHGDLSASDFIVSYFMEDQMKSINEMAKLVTILSGVGDESLGRFMFDRELLKNHVLPKFNVYKNSKTFENTEQFFNKFN